MLDGGIASLFGSVFGAFYLDATLHSATFTDDGQGGGSASHTDTAIKAQLDQSRQFQDGHADTDQRILVLADGIPVISVDDEVTVDGIRWTIASVTMDPAQSHYELRGRLSGIEAS